MLQSSSEAPAAAAAPPPPAPAPAAAATLDVLKKIGLLYSTTGSGHRILIGFHLDRFTQSWMYCWLLREFALKDWIAPQRPAGLQAGSRTESCSNSTQAASSESFKLAQKWMVKPSPSSPYLLIEDTLGTVSLSQMPSASSLSRISHANMVGFCLL